MSRVLLTGAGGFIGRHALQPLLATGMEVHAVSSRDVPTAAPPGARWHRCDLLASHSVAELLETVRPTHLLHLAWYTQPGAYWTAGENLDWVQASLRLLRAFGETGGERAVFAGTCAEYAWERCTHCVEEQHPVAAIPAAQESQVRAERPPRSGTPTAPATLYGAAKHGLHVVADAWARQSAVALAWGRIFSVYGPHEHPDRLVGGLARALLQGERAACSHGRQVRDYLYAPELGAAFAALLAGGVTGPVNMASGEAVRIADVITAVAAAAGRPDLVRRGAQPVARGEPETLTADVRRLRMEVGWAPSIGLREGVARTVDWWRQELAAESRTGVSPALVHDASLAPANGRPAALERTLQDT